MARVAEGDAAPDVELPDQEGRPVRLADLRGRPLVLFFYPHDFTPTCTRENCTFRDDYSAFREIGAEVLGVSPDPPQRHAAFAARHKLPFRLLSDTSGQARRAFGVGSFLGLYPRRVTFVIDADGRVLRRFEAQFQGAGHAREALRVLRERATPTAPPPEHS
jgi:thioredoxin-dependent peroxiredoxin